MTCRAAVGMVYHAPDFSVPAPGGFVPCLRCRALITQEQFTREPCAGHPLGRADALGLLDVGALPCRLCGVPVAVAAPHRPLVERFGAVCDACANPLDTRLHHDVGSRV